LRLAEERKKGRRRIEVRRKTMGSYVLANERTKHSRKKKKVTGGEMRENSERCAGKMWDGERIPASDLLVSCR
jgi:hypothetical protein